MKFFIQILFFISYANTLFGQMEIMIFNPSFEGEAAHSTLPILWENCNIDGSPPDIHSNNSNFFEVRHDAQHQNTYIGMVVREDNTWEAIGQYLESPLYENSQYLFSIHLAWSDIYESYTRRKMEKENFDGQAVLRIWGGNESGHRGQMLAESVPVTHTDWQEYTFEFEPIEEWDYLILEAFFEDENGFAYNGNLLMDNCSSILLYNTIKLSDLLDYESLTLVNLLNLIIECKQDDDNLSDTTILDIVYDSWLFEQTCKKLGMKETLMTLDSTRIQHFMAIYERLGLQKTIDILEKTLTLTASNSNLLKDVRFLKTCNQEYQSSLITEELYDKRLEFIRLNHSEIIAKLKDCD